jgi:hypothetical protein
MIVYHPKADLYNCIFRLVSLAKIGENKGFDVTRFRMYDFFVLFPHFVEEVSFPRGKEYSWLKRKAKELPKPYENMPDKKRLFSELSDYQIQAVQILKAKKIFQEKENGLAVSENFYSESVQSLFEDNFILKSEFFNKLVIGLNDISLTGEKGLKKRTGLMEYRYDVA